MSPKHPSPAPAPPIADPSRRRFIRHWPSVPVNPCTVEEIVAYIIPRRHGVLKALTSEVDKFFAKCTSFRAQVTGRVTTKADVYSFRVILMELITGRKALNQCEGEDDIHLVTWFRRMLLNNNTFPKAIDPLIELGDDEGTLESIHTIAELAGHCCAREPHQRPDMGHAVNVLSSLAEMWKPADDMEASFRNLPDMSLLQSVQMWQATGDSQSDDSTQSFLRSRETTQGSIPTGPGAFSSFTSLDGR